MLVITMPSWVCPPPLLLDLSFPHSMEELTAAEDALVDLDGRLDSGEAILVLTPMMGLLLTEVDYSCGAGQVAHISGWLESIVMGKGNHVVWFDPEEGDGALHPEMPCCAAGNSELWRESAQSISRGLRAAGAPVGAIGVVCIGASAGGDLCPSWPVDASHLVLVSTRDLGQLESAYKYEYDPSVLARPCSLQSVRDHHKLLGATSIKRKRVGGSHVESAVFPGGRPWPLDVNDDPIPEKNITSLQRCARLPGPYVRTVLNTGHPPARRPWLEVGGTGVLDVPLGSN